jgi:hypothetical protein
VSGVLDRLEALVAEFRACDAACDAGGMVWNGCQIAREVRTLIPLLNTLLVADDQWEDVVGPDSTASLELCSLRAKAADDAVRALLAALRTAPAGEAP